MKNASFTLAVALLLTSAVSASALLSEFNLPVLDHPEPPIVSTERESILPFVHVQK